MTATRVGDQAVIEDQPAKAPITDYNGNPVYFKQIRELLLADGTVVFGCLHCDYTGDNPTKVRAHLGGKHADRRPPRRRPAAKVPADLRVSDLLAASTTIEKLTAERDAWKTRALKAERELTTVRRVLNGSA